MTAEVKKIGGNWCVQFKIDNQGFTLTPCEDEKSAYWMKSMLEKAFKNHDREKSLQVVEKAVEEATKDVEGQTVYSQGYLQGCRKVSRRIKKEVEE